MDFGIVFIFGFWRYFGNSSKYGDFSYGVYIVHWPILQTLVAFRLNELNPLVFLALAVTLIALAAFLMWHLVEKRFLARVPLSGGVRLDGQPHFTPQTDTVTLGGLSAEFEVIRLLQSRSTGARFRSGNAALDPEYGQSLASAPGVALSIQLFPKAVQDGFCPVALLSAGGVPRHANCIW